MEHANDEYWLAYGKKSIEEVQNLNVTALNRLEQFILWLWTAYVAVYALSATFEQFDATVFELILMALPMLTLILSYWFCEWVKRPIFGEFDPRSASEIRNFHNRTTRKKFIRIVILGVALLVAAISVAEALIVYKFSKQKKDIQISLERKRGNFFVSASFPKDQYVILEGTAPINGIDSVIYVDTLKTVRKSLYISVPDTTGAKEVKLSVRYKDGLDDKVEHSYSEYLEQ